MTSEISDEVSRAQRVTTEFEEKWLPQLQNQLARLEMFEEALVEGKEHVSQMARIMMLEEMQKVAALMKDASNDHKKIHGPISQSGRLLEKNFHSDLGNLIKNQKDFDSDPKSFQKANELIFDHLLSLGRLDVVDTFMNESESQFLIPPNYDRELVEKIMVPFHNKDYEPAIEWLNEHAPSYNSMLFALHKQTILEKVKEGKRKEALTYAKKIQVFEKEYYNEIQAVMFVIVHYPNVGEHKNLFLDGIWLKLEEDMAQLICGHKSKVLSKLIEVGATAVPNLLDIKAFMSKRISSNWLTDELPTEISIPEYVHSTFTCPILKVQTTEQNMPTRLLCGHVISEEACKKLISSNRSHKLKCPYCPTECTLDETKKVFF